MMRYKTTRHFNFIWFSTHFFLDKNDLSAAGMVLYERGGAALGMVRNIKKWLRVAIIQTLIFSFPHPSRALARWLGLGRRSEVPQQVASYNWLRLFYGAV